MVLIEDMNHACDVGYLLTTCASNNCEKNSIHTLVVNDLVLEHIIMQTLLPHNFHLTHPNQYHQPHPSHFVHIGDHYTLHVKRVDVILTLRTLVERLKEGAKINKVKITTFSYFTLKNRHNFENIACCPILTLILTFPYKVIFQYQFKTAS